MDGNDGDDNDGQVVSGSLEDCCEIIARFEMVMGTKFCFLYLIKLNNDGFLLFVILQMLAYYFVKWI